MKIVKELKRVFPFDFTLHENKLYYAAYNLNGIFCFDLEKEENEFLTSIPDEKVDRGNYYTGIVLLKEGLFFVPDQTTSFIFYNIKTKKIQKIPLPYTEVDYPIYSKFLSVIYHEGRLFCIPIRYPGIVEIDEKGIAILHSHSMISKKEILVGMCCSFNNKIYMTLRNTELKKMLPLLIFDINNKQFEEFGDKYGEIYNVCTDGKGLWMVSQSGLLYWNANEDKIRCYKYLQELEDIKELLKIVYFEKNIWIFSGDGSLYTIFEIEKKAYKSIIYFSDRICYEYITKNYLNNYITLKVFDSRLYCFNASTGKMFVYFNGKEEKYILEIPKNYKIDHCNNQDIVNNSIINEGQAINIHMWGTYLDVNDYLNCTKIVDMKEDSRNKNNIGKLIFSKMK